MLKDYIEIDPEVQDALNNDAPLVSLESTIISHGMPHPINLETATEVERIIREAGAIPATIAIIDGIIRIGLSREELTFMATSKDIKKACERDIPFILAKKMHAATTVSASLAITHAAGIHLFATGGLGAVGPDASKTFDIWADLLALGKYPCITVCSGAKAFMDIAATLEYLETHGTPVVVWKSHIFPWFYSINSGVNVDWSVQNEDEVAEIFLAILSVDPSIGLLVAVPIPESDAIPEEQTHKAITNAVGRASELGISGKEYTPNVLSFIKEFTEGKSLQANVALIKHNAEVAAKIAVCLKKKNRSL